jgi:DNA-binding transcriptional LysR family regulator
VGAPTSFVQCMMFMTSMHDVQLSGLDLNALVVLDALLSTRSVTVAASRVGLSQSATSHALARLRRTFGDALLVRGPGGLVPTARAEAMALPLRDALAAMRRAIAGPSAFDPATSRRRFTLATADYVGLVLLPALMRRLAEAAPGIDIVVRTSEHHEHDDLAQGEHDLSIGPPAPGNERPGIRARKLFDERFVCLVRKDHPALGRKWTPQSFAVMRHAFIAPRGRPGGVVDEALSRLGFDRRIVLMLPHFLVVPFVVAQSDLVLTLPERVARTFVDQLPLAIVEPPLALPGFSMMLLWHDRAHDDPAHRWLRDLCVEVAGSMGVPRARPRRRRG